MAFFTRHPSPIGPLLLISDGTALTGLQIDTGSEHMNQQEDLPVFCQTKQWLDDYFSGICRPIDFPLSPIGTTFQKRVLQLLLTIPFGETTTYGSLARQLSCTMSAQAVGQAVGKNPILILIPCHRCLGANRKLTGFSAGLEKKKWLLRHEGSPFTE